MANTTKMTAAEILARTLRQPTARLSEAEANERAEELRQRSHFFPHGSKGVLIGKGPAGEAFRRDWSRMMAREGGVE